MFETILNIIQAVAVTGAAIVGAWGLNTWRREMIGRKKADLAERTLAAFYEARDIIKPIFDSWEREEALRAADFLGSGVAEADNVVPRTR